MRSPKEIRRLSGLPEGRITRTLCNQVAQQVIVEMLLPGSPPTHRLFVRPANAESFEVIGSPKPNESFASAITCEAPIIFFLVTRWKSIEHTFGGYFGGLFQMRLDGANAPTEMPLSNMLPPGSHLSALLRARDDGMAIDCISGFGERKVEYFTCRLDFRAGSMTRICPLITPWF